MNEEERAATDYLAALEAAERAARAWKRAKSEATKTTLDLATARLEECKRAMTAAHLLRRLEKQAKSGDPRDVDAFLEELARRGQWTRLRRMAGEAIETTPKRSSDPGWDGERLARLLALHRQAVEALASDHGASS